LIVEKVVLLKVVFISALCMYKAGAYQGWMASGQRNNFAAPMFEPKVFRRKCTVLKKVLATLLGLLGGVQWFGAWGIVPPYPPRCAHGAKLSHWRSCTVVQGRTQGRLGL